MVDKIKQQPIHRPSHGTVSKSAQQPESTEVRKPTSTKIPKLNTNARNQALEGLKKGFDELQKQQDERALQDVGHGGTQIEDSPLFKMAETTNGPYKPKNREIKDLAKKVMDRLPKFELGLKLAGQESVPWISKMDASAALNNLVRIADENNDPALLQRFLLATNVESKLGSGTNEAGRAKVRAVQLYNAVQGDGSYDSVKANVGKLETSQTKLREMAKDPKVLDHSSYIDANKLIKTTDGTVYDMKNVNREWFLDQATLMEAFRGLGGSDKVADKQTQKQLAFMMLQSFAKTAQVVGVTAEETGVQTTPLQLLTKGEYHRSSGNNALLNKVNSAFMKDMGLQDGQGVLVDSPRFGEILGRLYPPPEGVNNKIDSQATLEGSIDKLLDNYKKGVKPGDGFIVFDATQLIASKGVDTFKKTTMGELEAAVLAKAKDFLKDNPGVKPEDMAKDIISKLQITGFTQHKGTDVMLTQPFLGKSAAGKTSDVVEKALLAEPPFVRNFDGTDQDVGKFRALLIETGHAMSETGFRLDPMKAKQAWLEVEDPMTILKQAGIPVTEFATPGKTPVVAPSVEKFLDSAAVKKFAALSTASGAPPYQQVLTAGTMDLLNGLKDVPGGLNKAFADKGLSDVLQTSYFRMMNAMASAANQKDNQIGFQNHIEVVHQEIQNILGLVNPHGPDAFATGMKKALTSGDSPTIPKSFKIADPKIHAKPSAMHCMASILSGIESEKGSNKLNVCVLKDNYYETGMSIGEAKTYQTTTLDGETLRNKAKLDKTVFGDKVPLDVFVCDFHHNISLSRTDYHPEDLIHQVDEMFAKGIVSDKFTVAIDCTINHVQSKEIQAFLQHNKKRIEDGSLNVVMYRSAQKFDMMGMDNYYGGYTVSVNNGKAFKGFDARMAAKDDQLEGLAFQGLAHLAKNGTPRADQYRQALMDNTAALYAQLPPEAIAGVGNNAPMQVSKIEDPKSVFLDIKFPGGNEVTAKAFDEKIREFVKAENLPMTTRPSFGFMTTNYNFIQRPDPNSDQYGSTKIRINPGLDHPDTLARYGAFFNAVHEHLDKAAKDGATKGLTGDALHNHLADALKSMDVTNIPTAGDTGKARQGREIRAHGEFGDKTTKRAGEFRAGIHLLEQTLKKTSDKGEKALIGSVLDKYRTMLPKLELLEKAGSRGGSIEDVSKDIAAVFSDPRFSSIAADLAEVSSMTMKNGKTWTAISNRASTLAKAKGARSDANEGMELIKGTQAIAAQLLPRMSMPFDEILKSSVDQGLKDTMAPHRKALGDLKQSASDLMDY